MKKFILTLCAILCCIGFLAGAEETSILKNGDFEQISEVTKGAAPWLMRKVQAGWDFTPGPIAYLPQHWGPNVGKAKVRVIDAKENPADKANVHGGNRSLYLEPKHAHMYNSGTKIKPGKYKVSVWAKGEGYFLLGYYNYSNTNRNMGAGSCKVEVRPTAEWKEYSAVTEIGKNKPDIGYSFLSIIATRGKIYIDDIKVVPVK